LADKQLTAKVRLNTTQAEKSLDNLVKKINKINNTVNKIGNNNQVEQKLNRSQSKLQNIISKVNSWAKAHKGVENGAKQVNLQYKKSGSLLSTIGGKLRQLADTYLGVMGMKSIINTSDMITSAENKLNYVSAQQLGSQGTNADGSYSTATIQATQQAMDKMYASSQKVRMGYADMMSNVSKSMALAGNAFDNNTDKAIRFQEIMAEAYAIGGASAQEMSSSMYQLIQALGAGTLAGDELRSVREGAPLAYKAIEEFAQKTLKCKDSLKELASDGLITADMVTAAIMQSGEAMDEAFAQTEQTFAQTWEQIKNAAIYAFKPISKMLRTALNDAIDNGLLQKVETVFTNIAKGIMIVFQVIGNTIRWVADNWSWLQHILIGGLIIYMSYLIVTTALAIKAAYLRIQAWLLEHKAMLKAVLIIAIIMIAIYALWQVWNAFTSGAISGCQAIALALLIVGVAIGVVMLLFGNLWGLVVIGAAIAAYFIITKFSEVCQFLGWLAGWIVNIILFIWNVVVYVVQAVLSAIVWLIAMTINLFSLLINLIVTGLYLLLTFIWNVLTLIVNSVMAVAMAIGTIIQWIIAFIVNLVMACGQAIVAISHNVVAAIINVATGLWNSISAIAQNIGIAFQNAWTWAKNTFWEFIADVLRGVSKLEPVINGIAKLVGKSGVDFGGLISAAESKKGNYQSFVTVPKVSDGMDTIDYKDISDAWSNGWNTMDFANMGDMVSKGWNTMDRANYSDAIKSGMDTTGYVDANEWMKNTWDYMGMAHADYVDPGKWGETAGNWGSSVEDKINGLLSKFQNTDDKEKGSLLDKIGEKLGLDFSGLNDLPSITDPNMDLSKLDDIADKLGGSSPSGTGSGDLGKIGDDVGKIADSVDLSEEDLEYLRKIAEMEWKKEYTTNTIQVDMNNYNTISGENDLDGIVTKLSETLYEELNIVANGVYA
jgi:tape measure domain-containing protein